MIRQDFSNATPGQALNGYSQNGMSWTDPSGAWGFAPGLTPPELMPLGVPLGDGEAGMTPASPNYSIDVLANFCSAPAGLNIYLRKQSNGDCYLLQWTSAEWRVMKRVSGNWSQVGSTNTANPPPTGAYAKVSFRVDGNNFFVVLGSSIILSVTDPFNVITAAGVGGLMAPSAAATNTTGCHILDVCLNDCPVVQASAGTRYVTGVDVSATVNYGVPPYTHQWYRSQSSGFIPGPANAISGATGLTLTDTLNVSGTWFYRLLSTDSVGAIGSSLQVATAQRGMDVTLGWIGDSITSGAWGAGGVTIPTMVKDRLSRAIGRTVNSANAAVGGTRSSDWLPGGALDTAAHALFVSSFGTPSPTNPIHIPIRLGVNDGIVPPVISSATFASNMAAICAAWVGRGYVPILCNPMMPPDEAWPNWHITEDGITLIQQIGGVLDALADGVTILRGDATITEYTAVNVGETLVDIYCAGMEGRVHPTQIGADTYALKDVVAFARLFS